MSETKKPTGIIYRAFNKISGKSYVGQTIQTLELRRKEHIRKAGKLKTVFSRALLKYPNDSWEWTILAEVPVEKLDEYERFFIKDLGTYKHQYNMTIGGQLTEEGCPRWDSNVYELYKPGYGVVAANIYTFVQLDPMLRTIRQILNGKRKHINGWVILDNKDKYDDIMNFYEFYHKDFGIVKCTPQQLGDTYIQPNGNPRRVKELTRGSKKASRQYMGWILAENKNCYEEIMQKAKKDN